MDVFWRNGLCGSVPCFHLFHAETWIFTQNDRCLNRLFLFIYLEHWNDIEIYNVLI